LTFLVFNTMLDPVAGRHEEAAMRTKLTRMILASAAILAAAPSYAQTYDPNYPVCLQVYVPRGGYIDCSFTSLPQCQATASGRAAQCYANPYFAYAHKPRKPAYRSRRVH
jgi:hypothetical protein